MSMACEEKRRKMENKDLIALPRDSFRELNRMMYTMYKFFNFALSEKAVDYRDFTPSDALHLQLKPADYYHFESGSDSVKIHQIRTHYTLKLCGFTTDLFKPFRPASEYKYSNCFGDFPDLDKAKFAFYQVCNDYMRTYLGALF